MTQPMTLTLRASVGRRARRSRRWWHWWRAGMTGGLIGLLLGALAGCTANTRPGGYDCVNSLGGCFTLLALSSLHKDASGVPDLDGTTITGVASQIEVVPLHCDAACRASSGDPARPGFIATYLQVWEQDNGAFIRLGYRTNASGDEEFFEEYAGPGIAFTSFTFALTGVSAGGEGYYGQFSIAAENGVDTSCICLVDDWVVRGDRMGVLLLAQRLPFTTKAFTPNYLYFVQQVWGKSGASADYTTFERNYYGETEIYAFAAPDWHYLRHDGVPPIEHGTAAHPSFGNWTFSPSADSTGGVYHLYCCAPL
jgi:hypothetical protein